MVFQSELIVYFLFWTSSVLFSIFRFARSSYLYFQNYEDHFNDFSEGIPYLSSKRDRADTEWESTNFLLTNFYPWAVIYLSVAEILRSFYPPKKLLQLWQICFLLVYLSVYYGFYTLIIILIQPTVYFVFLRSQSKTTLIWSVSIINMAVLAIFKATYVDYIWNFIKLGESEANILIVSLFWLNLKCTSFYLEKTGITNVLDFFSYALYPPTFFSGPIILYDNFKGIYDDDFNALLVTRLKNITVNIVRTLFWFSLVNLSLHYVYVNCSSFHPEFINNLDSWALYGFGYTMGQYFHLKYLVIYGLSTSIASFENVKVPRLPRCIGRVHLYSDMWKYFDPGLYLFLLRHIYIPLTGVVSNKLTCSFICFCYVYVWHGLENNILVWTALNYFGIVVENVFGLNRKQESKDNYWKTRRKCLLAAPLLAVSAISNFYFFGGTEVGWSFFYRIYTDAWYKTMFLLFILYCCCQVSTRLRAVTSTKCS